MSAPPVKSRPGFNPQTAMEISEIPMMTAVKMYRYFRLVMIHMLFNLHGVAAESVADKKRR